MKMESIQEIRKINELSKILKKHGFAEDSLDAIKSAKSITSKQKPIQKQQEAKMQDSTYEQMLVKINNLEKAKHRMLATIDELKNEIASIKAMIEQGNHRATQQQTTINNTRPAQTQQRASHPEKAKLPNEYGLDKIFSVDNQSM